MARAPAPTDEQLLVLDPDGSFVRRLHADRDALVASLAAGDDTSILTLIHGLAGAAGTFGYPVIGDLALALDDVARRGEQIAAKEVEDLIAALTHAIKSA